MFVPYTEVCGFSHEGELLPPQPSSWHPRVSGRARNSTASTTVNSSLFPEKADSLFPEKTVMKTLSLAARGRDSDGVGGGEIALSQCVEC